MAAAWQKITAWACLLLAAVILHVALGEVILTSLLIVFTTVAFTGRKGPQQINGRSAEDIDIEVPQTDEDEPTANPLNAAQNDASEETPKLRPLRSPSAELRRSAPVPAAPPARLPFLDTVKVFLTALVVLHHCACAFGACGEGSWYLIVKGGGGPRAFRFCVKTFVTWNQAYFMSLFFFVSACSEIKISGAPRHRRSCLHTDQRLLRSVELREGLAKVPGEQKAAPPGPGPRRPPRRVALDHVGRRKPSLRPEPRGRLVPVVAPPVQCGVRIISDDTSRR